MHSLETLKRMNDRAAQRERERDIIGYKRERERERNRIRRALRALSLDMPTRKR